MGASVTRILFAVLMVLGLSSASMAQVRSHTPMAPGEAYTLDIPAGPLSDALLTLAEQTGLNIIFRPRLVAGVQAARLSGTYDAATALDTLLGQSGLSVEWADGMTVSILPPDRHPHPETLEEGLHLNPPPAPEVIVVHGYMGALSRALEEKRTNPFISDVLSADDMGNLPNNNLTEALARLPGLNAVRNHTTGEGDRVTLRGLSSEYNKYLVNGVTLGGVGSPQDNFFRGVRLSFLSPEGIDQITVRKSIMPDMDGDTIGGTIDIRTPSAFDFEGRHRGLSGEIRVQDKYDYDRSHMIAASYADHLTPTLGLFITGFHEQSRSQYEEIGDHGDHLPATWYETDLSVEGWDYDRFHIAGFEMSKGRTQVERFGINGSLHYERGVHNWHLHVQYNEYIETEEDNMRFLRNRAYSQSRRFYQADFAETGITPFETWQDLGEDEELGRIYGEMQGGVWRGDYTLDQIRDVDEDERLTDADRACVSLYSICGGSGVWDPREFNIERAWSADRNHGLVASFNLGGESVFDRWSLSYEGAISQSEDVIDYGYEAEFETRVGEALRQGEAWLGNSSVDVWSSPNPRFLYYTLTPEGHRAVQTPSSYDFAGLSARQGGVKERLYQAQIDLRYEPSFSWVRAWQGGVKIVRSERERYEASPRYDEGPFEHAETYGDFAPWFGEDVTDMFGGRYREDYRLGQTLDSDKMIGAIGADFKNLNYESAEAFTYNETTYATYAMGEFRFGKMSVLAGLRVEHVRYDVDSHIESEVQTRLYELGEVAAPYRRNRVDNQYTQVLPSIHITYPVSRDVIARAAAWTSYARPSVERATRPLTLDYDRFDPETEDELDDPLAWRLVGAEVGNPGLKATQTYNLDGSLEWYHGRTGAYSIAVFYKHIENFLIRGSSSVIRNGTQFDIDVNELVGGFDLGPNPRADRFYIEQVTNGEQARIYGIEASARETLRFLPAPFDQLGVGVNATYQNSRTHTGLSWHPRDYTLPFFETPQLLFNGELYWSSPTWEGYVSYTYQSEFLEDYEYFNNNPYEQDYHFVDLSLSHHFSDSVEVSLEVQNLFDSHIYWYTFGKDDQDLRSYIQSGRMISLGFHSQF